MSAAESLILAALQAGDRRAARVLLSRRILDREAHNLPTTTDAPERN